MGTIGWISLLLVGGAVAWVGYRVSRAPAGSTVWDAVFPPSGVAGAAQPVAIGAITDPRDPFGNYPGSPYGNAPGV